MCDAYFLPFCQNLTIFNQRVAVDNAKKKAPIWLCAWVLDELHVSRNSLLYVAQEECLTKDLKVRLRYELWHTSHKVYVKYDVKYGILC